MRKKDEISSYKSLPLPAFSGNISTDALTRTERIRELEWSIEQYNGLKASITQINNEMKNVKTNALTKQEILTKYELLRRLYLLVEQQECYKAEIIKIKTEIKTDMKSFSSCPALPTLTDGIVEEAVAALPPLQKSKIFYLLECAHQKVRKWTRGCTSPHLESSTENDDLKMHFEVKVEEKQDQPVAHADPNDVVIPVALKI